MNKGLLGYPRGLPDLGDLLRDVVDGDDEVGSQPPVRDMAGWFDASSPGTLTVASDLVSAWADKSINGNNAAQASGGAQPGYGGARERKINGVVALDFDRGDGMGVAGISADVTVLSAFLVAEVDVIGAGAGVTNFWSSSGGWPMHYTDATDGIIFWGAGTQAIMAGAQPLIGVPRVYGVVWDAPSCMLCVNDSIYVTSATDAGSAGTLEIGSRGGGQPFDGGMAELLWYTRALSTAEIRKTTEYLMRKWGIA